MPFNDSSIISPESSADPPPAAAPVSPCGSETSAVAAALVAGDFRNVEDDYAIDPRVLGVGQCGSVRACTDRVTGRRRAVKSVRKGDPAVALGGLAREVRLLRDLRHPGIVRLVDAYEDETYVHIVTDLCEGGELFDRIADRIADRAAGRDDRGGGSAPCLAEDEAARILRQVLVSVSYLHCRGVVHRDIKPENLLFATAAAGSPVTLVDFGLARRRAGRRGVMRARVGTPYYMAPEILRRRHAGYDELCDMWSLGIVAYVMLCGYPPFNGHTDSEVFAAIRRGRCRFAKDDWSGVSREGKDFVRRLLRREPGSRMTAAQALEHPWIRKHADSDVEMSDEDRPHDLSVEVVYHQSRADSIIVGDIDTRNVGRTMLC